MGTWTTIVAIGCYYCVTTTCSSPIAAAIVDGAPDSTPPASRRRPNQRRRLQRNRLDRWREVFGVSSSSSLSSESNSTSVFDDNKENQDKNSSVQPPPQQREGDKRSRQNIFNHDSRIVGGRPAAVGEYPSFVHTLPPVLCGGTLIHPDIILTAAHCVGAFRAGVYIGGILRYGSDGTMLDVELEFPHPDFDVESQFNDIMLVKLTDPSNAPLVELNVDTARPVENDILTVIGYGNTADEGSTSNDLLEVEVEAFTDDFCFDLYRFYDPATMVCAGSQLGGRDSCQGDSGGPLFVAGMIQVGVVSSGSGCGTPNRPAIYTEVSAFEAFIRQGICDLSDVPPPSCLTPRPTRSPIAPPIPRPTVAPPVLQPFTVPPLPTPSPKTQRPTVVSSTLVPTSESTTYLPTSAPTSYEFSKSKKGGKKGGKGGMGKGGKGGKGKNKSGKGKKDKGRGKGKKHSQDDDDFVDDNLFDDFQGGSNFFTNTDSLTGSNFFTDGNFVSTTTSISVLNQRLRQELESQGPGIR